MTLPQLGFFLVVVNFQFILIMVPITTNYVSSYEKRITKILCPKERVYHVTWCLKDYHFWRKFTGPTFFLLKI